jgi:hypothetical protein
LRGVLSTREDIEISYTNYTKQTRFESVRARSLEQVTDLLEWHLEHERRSRKGWNNNLSLVGDGGIGEITWSMIAMKIGRFKSSVILLIPFSFINDSRNISRAVCTFKTIRTCCRAFCLASRAYIEGDELEQLIELVCERIRVQFGWNNCTNNNKIYRYRLVMIMQQPDLLLNRELHVHHHNGVMNILSGNLDSLDDRYCNLSVLPKDVHNILHISNDDVGFISM